MARSHARCRPAGRRHPKVEVRGGVSPTARNFRTVGEAPRGTAPGPETGANHRLGAMGRAELVEDLAAGLPDAVEHEDDSSAISCSTRPRQSIRAPGSLSSGQRLDGSGRGCVAPSTVMPGWTNVRRERPLAGFQVIGRHVGLELVSALSGGCRRACGPGGPPGAFIDQGRGPRHLGRPRCRSHRPGSPARRARRRRRLAPLLRAAANR